MGWSHVQETRLDGKKKKNVIDENPRGKIPLGVPPYCRKNKKNFARNIGTQEFGLTKDCKRFEKTDEKNINSGE